MTPYRKTLAPILGKVNNIYTVKMSDRNSNIKISKAKANRLFQEGYDLAFLTKKKIKPWGEIFNLWKIAATAGHTRTQFYLGTCYDFENGVKKNLSEAFNWYMKAATNGMMEAQYNIGFFIKKEN